MGGLIDGLIGGLIGGLMGGLIGGLIGGLMGSLVSGLVGGLVLGLRLTNRSLRLLGCLASQVLRFRLGSRGLQIDLSKRFDLRIIQEVVDTIGYKLPFSSKVVLDLFHALRYLVFFLDDFGKRAGNGNILVLGRICSAGP